MKRDREVCPNTGFGQNQMASCLATGQLACFFKSLHSFFAGDVAELSPWLNLAISMLEKTIVLSLKSVEELTNDKSRFFDSPPPN